MFGFYELEEENSCPRDIFRASNCFPLFLITSAPLNCLVPCGINKCLNELQNTTYECIVYSFIHWRVMN